MANGSKQLVGKAAISRNILNNNFTFGAFMGCFRVNPSINPYFIFALIESKKYRDYIDFLLSGSTINNLNPNSIELMEFAFPSDNEQNDITNIYSDLQEIVLNLEKKLQKLKHQKQGMMQALLTGKIRLV
jgi:type I restriction enzyme S subunit